MVALDVLYKTISFCYFQTYVFNIKLAFTKPKIVKFGHKRNPSFSKCVIGYEGRWMRLFRRRMRMQLSHRAVILIS